MQYEANMAPKTTKPEPTKWTRVFVGTFLFEPVSHKPWKSCFRNAETIKQHIQIDAKTFADLCESEQV